LAGAGATARARAASLSGAGFELALQAAHPHVCEVVGRPADLVVWQSYFVIEIVVHCPHPFGPLLVSGA
jgi:hypothetical protein